MISKNRFPAVTLSLSMIIFGTIGLLRRALPLGSATVAAARGVIGALTVFFLLLARRRRIDGKAIRKNLFPLLLSGGMIGFNWILLFEAYERTTVAVATLCYYTSPIFAILLAAIFLREKPTVKNLVCLVIAMFGMVCVSGVFGGEAAGRADGILFGVGAAVLYAGCIVVNKTIEGVSAYDKTLVQLLSAAVVVLPYALLTERTDPAVLTPGVIGLLLLAGILHTGVAYALYFASIAPLPTRTVAFFGYIDPIVAILLSVTFLHEPMGLFEILGVVCILGATVAGELSFNNNKGCRSCAAEKGKNQ